MPDECSFTWEKCWLHSRCLLRLTSPNTTLWRARVPLAEHPAGSRSHLSDKPHHPPPDETLASQAKVGGARKAKSRVPGLHPVWPPTDTGTHITLVNRFMAWDCFLEWKPNSFQHIYHLVDLPGCWREFENCDFFDLNIQNASLLKWGNSEVEMHLALRMVSFSGGSANSYSSHPDRLRFLSALLAGCRASVFSAV